MERRQIGIHRAFQPGDRKNIRNANLIARWFAPWQGVFWLPAPFLLIPFPNEWWSSTGSTGYSGASAADFHRFPFPAKSLYL